MLTSKNPITLEEYELPATLDDLQAIEAFLAANRGKRVVVVQGLGFVGAVMSLICANALTEEYAVIGVDLANESTFWKIKALNDGLFPLVADDPKIDEFFSNAKRKGNFLATYDSAAYKFADVVIVDINLDVQKVSSIGGSLDNFDVDLTGFSEAIRSIAVHCREDILILIETTVPPGTCEKLVHPLIKEEFKKRGLPIDKFSLGHSYERVMPGPQYVDSIREYPRVYSGIDDRSADLVEEFLTTIIDMSKCELTRLERTNASEIAKVLENSYRASNIAFAVEWSRFAEEAGVDLYAIVNAIRVRPTHANLMFPGLGVGGYCLTKDPLLASWARRSFFGSQSGLDISVNGVSVNDQMPWFAYHRLVSLVGNLSGKKVAILGVSYRGDVGDTRYTPVGPLVDLVRDAGGELVLHDPLVTFWEEQNCRVESDLQLVLDPTIDLVIVATGHSQYKLDATIDILMNLELEMIFDAIGIFSSEQLVSLQRKHRVSVLGRGDLDLIS